MVFDYEQLPETHEKSAVIYIKKNNYDKNFHQLSLAELCHCTFSYKNAF